MNKQMRPKVGLFGVGLQAYWEQFAGLEERLKGYLNEAAEKMEGFDAEIINLGLVDTPDKSFEAGAEFNREDVDILFLYVSNYALSATVLPAVKKTNTPPIFLKLS